VENPAPHVNFHRAALRCAFFSLVIEMCTNVRPQAGWKLAAKQQMRWSVKSQGR